MNFHIVLEKYDQLRDQFEKQNVLEQELYAILESIVISLNGNYPLVLSYFQQWHIGLI